MVLKLSLNVGSLQRMLWDPVHRARHSRPSLSRGSGCLKLNDAMQQAWSTPKPTHNKSKPIFGWRGCDEALFENNSDHPHPHNSKKSAPKIRHKMRGRMAWKSLEIKGLSQRTWCTKQLLWAYEPRLLWHTSPDFYAVWTVCLRDQIQKRARRRQKILAALGLQLLRGGLRPWSRKGPDQGRGRSEFADQQCFTNRVFACTDVEAWKTLRCKAFFEASDTATTRALRSWGAVHPFLVSVRGIPRHFE